MITNFRWADNLPEGISLGYFWAGCRWWFLGWSHLENQRGRWPPRCRCRTWRDLGWRGFLRRRSRCLWVLSARLSILDKYIFTVGLDQKFFLSALLLVFGEYHLNFFEIFEGFAQIFEDVVFVVLEPHFWIFPQKFHLAWRHESLCFGEVFHKEKAVKLDLCYWYFYLFQSDFQVHFEQILKFLALGFVDHVPEVFLR